jgi:exodeoxyribonuclease VII small subunit
MKKNDISSMSFEDAMKELESILNRIDMGEEKLENAVSSFERAALLRNHCEKQLESARLRIEKVVGTAEGKIVTEEIKSNV